MKSVADELRLETRRGVDRMSPGERLELALSLGEDDLQLFCSAQGLDREEALRRLRIQRARGRRPSVVNRT